MHSSRTVRECGGVCHPISLVSAMGANSHQGNTTFKDSWHLVLHLCFICASSVLQRSSGFHLRDSSRLFNVVRVRKKKMEQASLSDMDSVRTRQRIWHRITFATFIRDRIPEILRVPHLEANVLDYDTSRLTPCSRFSLGSGRISETVRNNGGSSRCTTDWNSSPCRRNQKSDDTCCFQTLQ